MLKKMRFLFVLLSFWFLSGISLADPCAGDLNNDNVVDGNDIAIFASEVGRSDCDGSSLQEYDLLEYNRIPDQTYYYIETAYGSPNKKGIQTISMSNKILNGQEVQVSVFETGYWSAWNLESYDRVEGNNLLHLGERWDGVESLFTPPVVYATRNMKIGQSILNMSELNGSLRYSEYTLLGLEDVTVPAGTFTNCLKILLKRSDGGKTIIYYQAKNVGIVKSFRAYNQGSGYSWELLNIRDNTGVKIYPGTICVAQGTWSLDSPAIQGEIAFSYSDDYNIILALKEYTGTYFNGQPHFYLYSTDGINFVPNPELYINQDLPVGSLVIDSGLLTGQLTISGVTLTFSGSVDCY